MSKKTDEDLRKIIDHYGLSHQLRKLQEEVWELNEAILSNMPQERVTEELADCFVVLNQIRVYVTTDDLLLQSYIREKVQRTLNRMESK